MIRPTNIWGRLYDAAMITVPTDMIVVPIRMVFLRPNLSPTVKAMTAPKKQPTA